MKRRYAVTIDLFIYAKNDDAVRRKSNKIRKAINDAKNNFQAEVIEIKEVPFGAIGEMRSVKLDSEIEI